MENPFFDPNDNTAIMVGICAILGIATLTTLIALIARSLW